MLFSYRYINLLREIVDCSPKLASFSLRYLPVSIKGLTFAPKYDYDARRVGVKMLAKTNINKANEQVLRSNVDFSALFKGLYLGESEILLTHTHTGAGRNHTLSNPFLRAREACRKLSKQRASGKFPLFVLSYPFASWGKRRNQQDLIH